MPVIANMCPRATEVIGLPVARQKRGVAQVVRHHDGGIHQHKTQRGNRHRIETTVNTWPRAKEVIGLPVARQKRGVAQVVRHHDGGVQ